MGPEEVISYLEVSSEPPRTSKALEAMASICFYLERYQNGPEGPYKSLKGLISSLRAL